MAESDDAALARRVLALLDLTDLADNASERSVTALCRAALGPPGKVAALCVWPQFVPIAARDLVGSGVAIATAVNFPAGTGSEARVAEDAAEALDDGATEIEVVLPYRAFLAGDTARARGLIEAVGEACGGEAKLKVILETGALPDRAAIMAASRLAIEAGADFIKTSTGKLSVSATPEAAEAMLEVIAAAGRPVGLEPSGGILTLADAKLHLDLADRIMGPDWASPATFRFGAKPLHAALVAVIEGRMSAAPDKG